MDEKIKFHDDMNKASKLGNNDKILISSIEQDGAMYIDGIQIKEFIDLDGSLKTINGNSIVGSGDIIIDTNTDDFKLEEFVDVAVNGSDIFVSNELTPYAKIRLSTQDVVYTLNIIGVKDGSTGKILVEQTGFKKIATAPNIVGEFKLTQNPNTLVLCSYNVVGSIIYITTTTIIGDNQVALVQPVKDLSYTYYDNSSIGLKWTAPYASTILEPVSFYDIRYSNNVIDPDNSNDWNSLSKVPNNLQPKNPGNEETMTVIGLKPATDYYFYIKAVKITLGVTSYSPASNELHIKTSGSANIEEKAYNIPIFGEALFPQQYAYVTDSATDEICTIDNAVDEKEKNKFLADGFPDTSNKDYNTYWRTYPYSRDTAPFFLDIDLYQTYRLNRIYIYGRTKQTATIYAKRNLTDKFVKVGSISSEFNVWSMVNFNNGEYRVIRIAYDVIDFGSMSTNPVMGAGVEGFPDPQYGNPEPISNLLIFGLPMSKPDGIHEPMRRTTVKKTVDEFFSVNGHAYQQGRIHALSGGSKPRIYIHFGQFAQFDNNGQLITPNSLKDLRFRVNDIGWVIGNSGLNKGLEYNLRETYSKYGLKPYLCNTGVFDICYYDKVKKQHNRPMDDYWLPNVWKPVPKRGFDGLDRYYSKSKDPLSYKTYSKLAYALGAKYGSNSSLSGDNLFWPETESKTTGLNLISGLEMENEPDQNWSGWVGYSSSEEFSSVTSGTYDGHLGQMRDEDNNVILGLKPTGVLSVSSGTAGINRGYYFSAINHWKSVRSDGSLPADSFSLHRYFSNVGNQGVNSQEPIRYGITLEESIRNPVGGSILDIVTLRDRLTPKTELWLTEFGWGESGGVDTKSSYQCYSQIGRYVNGWLIPDRHRSEVKGAWIVRATLQMMSLGFDMCNYYSTECENNYFDDGRWGTGPGFEMFHWNDISSNTPGLKIQNIKQYETPFERGGFSSLGLFGQILGNGAYPITNAYWWTSTMRNTLRGYIYLGKKKHSKDPRITILCFRKQNEEKGAYVVYYDDMINTGIDNVDIDIPTNAGDVTNVSVYLPRLTNPKDVPNTLGNNQARTGIPTSRYEKYVGGQWVVTNVKYDGVNHASYTSAPANYPSNPQEGDEITILPTSTENPYFPIVGPVWAKPTINALTLGANQYEQSYVESGVTKWESKNNVILAWRQVNAVLDYIEYHPEGIKGSHGVSKVINKVGDHITVNVSEFPEFYLFDGIPDVDFDSKVTNLSSVPVNGNTINLWWNNTSTDDTSYDIFISKLPESGYTLHSNVPIGTENKAVIQGLDDDTTYYFKVRPKNVDKTGVMSDYISVKTFSELPAPFGLNVDSRTTTTIDISWMYTNNQLADFVYYAIYRSSDTSSYVLIDEIHDKNVRNYHDTKLSIGKTYSYRVRAIGLNGFSEYSNEVTTRTLLPEEMPPTIVRGQTDKLGSKISLTFDMNIEITDLVKSFVVKTISVAIEPETTILDYIELKIDPNNANVINIHFDEDILPQYTQSWLPIFIDYNGSNIRSLNGGLYLNPIDSMPIKNRTGDFSGINNVWNINFTDSSNIVDHSQFNNWNNILWSNGTVEYKDMENKLAEVTDLKLIKVDNGSNIKWGNLMTNGVSSLPTSEVPQKAIPRGFGFGFGAKSDAKIFARIQLVNLDITKVYKIEAYGGTVDNDPTLKRPARMRIGSLSSETIEQSTNRNRYMTIENIRTSDGVLDVDFITMYPENSANNTVYPCVNFMTITEMDNPDDMVNMEVFLRDISVTPVNPSNDIVNKNVKVKMNLLGVGNKYRISEVSDMSGVPWISIDETSDLEFVYTLNNESLSSTTIYAQVGNNNNDTKIRKSEHNIRLDFGIQGLRLNLVNNKNVTSKRKIKCSIDYTGDAYEYAIQESDNFNTATWIPIVNEFTYELSETLGSKIVYARVRKSDGTESETISKNINLISSNNERIMFNFGAGLSVPPLNTVTKFEFIDNNSNENSGIFGNRMRIDEDTDLVGTIYPSITQPNYGSFYLYNGMGELSDIMFHYNSKFYPIVTGTFPKEGTGIGPRYLYVSPKQLGLPSPYDNLSTLGSFAPLSADTKGRLVFTLPSGTYQIKFLSTVEFAENGMPPNASSTSFFAAYDISNYTVLDRVPVGPNGFTGALNTEFNGVLNFSLTSSKEIAVAIYNHSFAKLPMFSIIEIIRNPTSDPVLVLNSVKINDNSDITYSNNVNITADYVGEPKKYRISESLDSIDGASWVSFEGVMPYTFTDTDGLKTLYVQLQADTLITEVKSASIMYVKDNKNIINLSITVPNTINPDNVTLEFPKIKYNKKFMFSYITDDSCSIYQFIFSGINKRWVSSRTGRYLHMNFPISPEFSEGFTPTSVLDSTDGTGKSKRFATSVSVWPDKLVDATLGIGGNVGMYWPWMSEKEFKVFRDFGFSVLYHDMDDYDGAVVDEDKFNTWFNNTKNHFITNIGMAPKGLAEPNGDHRYLTYCRNISDIKFMSAQSGEATIKKVYPYRNDFTLAKNTTTIERNFAGASDYPTQIFNILKQFNDTSDLNSIYWLIGSAHTSSMWEYDLFKKLYDNFGSAGNDNMLFASVDEIFEYWFLSRNATVTKRVTGQTIDFEIQTPKLSDFWFNELSCMFNGISSTDNLSIVSNTDGLSHGLSNGKLMVNVNFNTNLRDKADKYTTIFEQNSSTTYTYDDAIYMINALKPDLRQPYMDRINNILQPVVISGLTINGGATEHTGKTVSVAFNVTSGNPSEYRIAESESDLTNKPWVGYTSNITYTFDSFGNKTIYGQVRNMVNTTNVVSSSINLIESLPKVLLGFNNSSPNTINKIVSNGLTTNQVLLALGSGYTPKTLVDTSGANTNMTINLQPSFYTANNFFGLNQFNNPYNQSITAMFATVASGQYDLAVMKQNYTAGNLAPEADKHKTRISFGLPTGSYRFRILMNTTTNYGITNENLRLNSLYGIFQGDTEIARKPVSDSSSFTGVGNQDFNQTFEFTVTDSSKAIDFGSWSTVGNNRPCFNLIEITKLS